MCVVSLGDRSTFSARVRQNGDLAENGARHERLGLVQAFLTSGGLRRRKQSISRVQPKTKGLERHHHVGYVPDYYSKIAHSYVSISSNFPTTPLENIGRPVSVMMSPSTSTRWRRNAIA